MKTTVEIADALLAAARQTAARENTTVRALVEDGLRKVLEQRGARAAFRLRKATFRGRGLRPEAAEQGWDRLRDITYEGRGA
jgi:Arc/MetJ family transcription regulator